jgi:hypothetical protein
MDAVRGVAQRRGVRPTRLIRDWVEAALAERASGEEATVAVSELLAFVRQHSRHRRE